MKNIQFIKKEIQTSYYFHYRHWDVKVIENSDGELKLYLKEDDPMDEWDECSVGSLKQGEDIEGFVVRVVDELIADWNRYLKDMNFPEIRS